VRSEKWEVRSGKWEWRVLVGVLRTQGEL
jgi:hypothetical protein